MIWHVVPVTGDRAAFILEAIGPTLAEWRRSGIVLPEPLCAFLADLEEVRDAWRAQTERSGTCGIPAPGRPERVASMSSTEAAKVLNCSDRNVRALCASGTLNGRKVGRALRVDAASVHMEALRRREGEVG